jgi:hypothetical protein
MALLYLGWVSDMGVEGGKVKLACEKKDHSSHSIEPGVSTRLPFGGLEQPVDGRLSGVIASG